MIEPEIVDRIKNVIVQSGRLREATFHRKFSQDEQDTINSWPSDEIFKVKALRTAGFGRCKCCDQPTDYVEKLRFYEFCSSECEIQSRRNSKLDSLKEELKNLNLSTLSTSYENIDAEMTFSCMSGHSFNSTLRHIRYRKKGCPLCQAETEENQKRLDKELIVQERKNQATKNRQHKKENTLQRRAALVNTASHVNCRACGEFTPFKLIKTKLYAPKFCGDACKKAYSEVGFKQRFEKLKSMLDPALHEHAGVITNNHHDVHHLIKFKECSHEYPVILRNIVRPSGDTYSTGKCPDCNRWSSAVAEKLISFIRDAGFSVVVNDRKVLSGQEIDIYIPEHSLGIEVNGIWWHSSFYKPNSYHVNKSRAAEAAGIKLLHFFSDEIDNQFDIVKSMVLQKLGISHKIPARKCKLDYIAPAAGREFLDKHHLQGKCNASYYVGLSYQGELISLMSFRKPFVKSQHQWEIARFCTASGITVVGGASRLLSFFEKRHEGNIMTFSDERYASGKVYEYLKFELSHVTAPGYSYVMQGKREHRLKFQKHLLEKRGIDIIGKTEEQIMSELKIPRIYDCGHKVWIKNRDS